MDFKTGHLDDELGKRLSDALHKTTFYVHLPELEQISSLYNPIDLAYAASRLPSWARTVLYKNLPTLQAKTIFVINTDSSTRWAVFRDLEDSELCSLIESMPDDEVVWILDDITERRYKRVLDLIPQEKAASIRELQKHERNSAGRLMTNEFFAFHEKTTIAEAADFIRKNPGIDMNRCVFVLGDFGQLLGYVPARNMLVNSQGLSLSTVMLDVKHKVHADSSRQEVVDIVERYQVQALPVVNDSDLLIGIITYEDILEAIEDIADDTISRMAGTAEAGAGSCFTLSIGQRFFSRAPWLVVTLFAGLISATILSYFVSSKAYLSSMIMFFVPLINGMSGNVGIQCSTVLVRSMATGTLSNLNRRKSVMQEFYIGMLTGISLGCLCGSVIYLLNKTAIVSFNGSSLQLGVMVSAGVLVASLTATTLGVVSPFFFVKIGVDPALASGPIVTAFNDIMSMFMFFVVSSLINSVFF